MIFTEGEGDVIESRLPFKIFSNLTFTKKKKPKPRNSLIAPPNIVVFMYIVGRPGI